MKRKWGMGLVVWMLTAVLAGCGGETSTNGENDSTVTTKNTETDSAEWSGNNEQSVNNEKPDNAQGTESGDTPKESAIAAGIGIAYTYKDVSLLFPKEWEGKYYVIEYESGFGVYQKASYDTMEYEGGILFCIDISPIPYYDNPSFDTLAYTKENAYYALYPTDVCFNYEVEEIAAEYQAMSEDIPEILYSFTVAAEEVQYNADEFILPMSEYYLLCESDIINLSETRLYFARNEIFARKGYHFENVFLQAYFERCSWYEDRGTENLVLSETDLANIETIKAVEESKKTDYPIELNAGEEYRIDLNQDGIEEVIQYKVEQLTYGKTGSIILNGQEYVLGEDIGMYPCYLNVEHFYITDISPYFAGLEIAIADYGSSYDLTTSFFTYDGELHYIGDVEGHPMKELNYFNGFAENTVTGRIRSDVLGTTYGYGSWWYNYKEGEIVFQETGLYPLEPWYSLTLLVDLPVHFSPDTESKVVYMEAGQTVYQLQTDCKEWIKLRDENGLEGWVHIENYSVEDLHRGIDSVFEGVQYFD